MKRLTRSLLTFVVAALFLSSCGSRGTKSAEDSVDSAGNLNRTRFNDSLEGMGTARMLVALYTNGHYDAVASERVSRQATDAHIKKFAASLGSSQEQLNGAITRMATRKQVSLPEGLSAEQKQRLAVLGKAGASALGSDYIRQLINDQKDALVILQQGALSTDTQIAGWSARMTPQVRSILDRATTARAYLDSLPAARRMTR